MSNLSKEEIYKRASEIDGLDGMTVNERLYLTGLMDIFDIAKKNYKELAKTILAAIRVDNESIDKILL